MCGLVGWATCGSGLSRNRRDEIASGAIIEQNEKCSYNMNHHERRDIGLICKHLINWGRSKFIEDEGFKSNLHYYVKSDVTLENVCVVAINKNQEK
ncbi:hypothetical protein WA026_023425 [Henosepilachna vigintioctopunctata]|uniref:tRNA:m(4)X modification enzyme TRM13 n=1 Tax=Henosepilachna vigintioctopunctata TaxID=420089 RepID=A0AAW1TTI8_9CUCU